MIGIIQLLALFMMGVGLKDRSIWYQIVYLVLALITILDVINGLV